MTINRERYGVVPPSRCNLLIIPAVRFNKDIHANSHLQWCLQFDWFSRKLVDVRRLTSDISGSFNDALDSIRKRIPVMADYGFQEGHCADVHLQVLRRILLLGS